MSSRTPPKAPGSYDETRRRTPKSTGERVQERRVYTEDETHSSGPLGKLIKMGAFGIQKIERGRRHGDG